MRDINVTVSVGLRRTLKCAAALTALSLACAGSASAKYEEGLEAFRQGKYDIAVDIWMKDGGAGDVRSMKMLGDVYSDNVCAEREKERMAQKRVMARAEPTPPKKVIPIDNVEALRWYLLAAFHDFSAYSDPTADDVRAQVVAEGCLPYVREEMTTAEVKKAEDLAARVFERGSARDLYNLGLMYQRGAGVQKDNIQALKLFELATTKGGGYGDAAKAFKKLTSITDALEEKAAHEKAVDWQPPLPDYYDKTPPALDELNRVKQELAQLREQDALDAISDIDVELIQRALKSLGFYFGQPDNKMGPETEAAIRRFQIAQYGDKDPKDVTAEEKIAYDTGVLSARQTVDLIRTAADRAKHPMSQYVYGIMSARGVGVLQDGSQAVKYLTLAADQDLSLAHYALGVLYRDGSTGLNEVTPDKGKAALHFARGCSLENGLACDAMKKLEYEKPRQSE